MKAVLLIALLIALPLVGIVVAGQPIDRYLEFPPQTRYVQHPPFSWTMFVALSVVVAALVVVCVVRTVTASLSSAPCATRAFPWWGRVGVLCTALFWVLAWNRFEWFTPFQAFTFTPLWLGYILAVNAWTYSRTGGCLMLDQPRVLGWLFPLSGAFWWCFEYLNRFVQNWYYVGAQAMTPWEYFIQASVPFSTVLPAVLSTQELLSSFPRIRAGWDRLPPVPAVQVKPAGWLIFALACGGLIGIGIWPNACFPLVWVAPLLLITSLQMMTGQETIFFTISRGDWTCLWLFALAALTCGFFWELWNVKSLAHWEYAIPSVHRFRLFEMPILGYAGYLPFGLECLAVTQFVFGDRVRHVRPPCTSRT
jgi:hypothetical protein